MERNNPESFSITDIDAGGSNYGTDICNTATNTNAGASTGSFSSKGFDNQCLNISSELQLKSSPQSQSSQQNQDLYEFGKTDNDDGCNNYAINEPNQFNDFSLSLEQSDESQHPDLNSPYKERPICQSYSDIDQSVDVRTSTNRNQSRFLTWFSKHFIVPQSHRKWGSQSSRSHLPSPDPDDRHTDTLWYLNYREAAIFLEEGYNNDKFDYHPRMYAQLPAYLAGHNHLYYLIDLAACLLVLTLAIFEKPAINGYRLTESVHALMELFGLTVIAVVFWIKYQWIGTPHFFRHRRTLIKTLVLALMIIEAVVVLARQDSHFRVTRSLRPVFLIDSYYFGGVRRVIRQMIQSLRSFIEMLMLLILILSFFSISAFYLFASVENYEQFSSISNSFVSLYVLMTTSNFPDVMMPAYKHNQLFALFFIAFIAVNVYFLLNVMLAVVYNTFKQIEKDKFRKLLIHRRDACEQAFQRLVTKSVPNIIQFQHFCGLLEYLIPKSSLMERYLMYKALLSEPLHLDTSPTSSPSAFSPGITKYGNLTLEKFYNIYEVCYLKWCDDATHAKPWFERSGGIFPPLLVIFRTLHRIVTHRSFDYITYAIIGLASVYQLLDAIIGHERWQERVGLPTSAMTICLIFITIYMVEIAIKLLALGWREYFRKRWNCFDFAITVIAFITFVLSRYAILHSVGTSLFSLRALRLLDLLRQNFDLYRDILGPFAFIILKRFTSVTLVVLIVYYFFAIIAMECFAGYQLADCCRNTSIETYYAISGPGKYYYYLNNFDNIARSYITLFELMVVNNWPVIMKSYVIVTDSPVTHLFFMIFFMTSLLVITIVIAFVIDTIEFQILYKHKFGQKTLSAKIEVRVPLSIDEVDKIARVQNGIDAENSSLPHPSRLSSNSTGTLIQSLLASPFPPSWSLLKAIFGNSGGFFERMHTFSNVSPTIDHSVPTHSAAQTINTSSEEIVRNAGYDFKFRGTRYRDKFSYNLRMYNDEIQSWIEEHPH